MKKLISLMLVTVLSVILFAVPSQAVVTSDEELIVASDEERIVSSDEELIVSKEKIIETAEGLYNVDIQAKTAGLIAGRSLYLSETSSNLIITAKTVGSTEVTKCGFTYIKLQRLISGTWTNYTTYCYYDQYNNSTAKTFSKYCSPPKGYTYRVICEHYAEKPYLIFFTQSETSYNVTSALVF